MTNQKKFKQNHGSIVGGFLTLLCGITSISYIIVELHSMQSGSYDNYNAILQSNNFKGDLNHEFIKNNSFFPMLSIKPVSGF